MFGVRGWDNKPNGQSLLCEEEKPENTLGPGSNRSPRQPPIVKCQMTWPVKVS